MKKILLIQSVISHYRVPVYNLIGEKYDLTVMYSNGNVPEGCKFKTLYMPCTRKKRFFIHDGNLRHVANQYDVVIGLMSYDWLSILALSIGKKRYKFIPWGIGVPASYSVKYDDPSKKRSVFILKHFIKWSDAAIFYSDYPKEKYIRMGLNPNKLFVAHNTVDVKPISFLNNRDSILFVGTLYRAKSVRNMIEIYQKAYIENPNVPLLRIVGDGDEFEDIRSWILDNGLENQILLEGAVFDESILAAFFSKAYACISLGQAGLSVQKAMGYGVPFITSKDSYTGGERLDIQSNINGVLLNNENDFKEVLISIANNPTLYIDMGKNAYDFYHKNRTIEQMADGVIEAIESVLSNK